MSTTWAAKGLILQILVIFMPAIPLAAYAVGSFKVQKRIVIYRIMSPGLSVLIPVLVPPT